MGNATMTSAYVNISENTYDINKYHGLLITVIIAASTMIISIWQSFGQKYLQS
jgi:hypothetical protein